MIVAWVLFPLVLLAVCLGCGLLVERVGGWQLPGALLASVGLALVIVAATLATDHARTAPLTTASVVVLALAGYASSWRRARGLRPERWALAVGLGAYAVFAAPVVLSGNATFLGYFTLNDAAFHFALIDQLLAHGRDLAGVAPSALSYVLNNYISTNYPVGAQVGLGAVRPLVGQDVAWIFQPYIAVILSLGAVALYQLLDGVVRVHGLRALCAFIAAQAGLVYAYYLEASIKELATTWIITVNVVLVFATLRRPVGLRRVVPLAVVAVAGLDVLELAIAPWLALPLAVFVVASAWQYRHAARHVSRRRLALGGAVLVGAVALLAAPIIRGASTFLHTANSVLTQQNDLGNLPGPLQKWELFGIWPTGDFRFPIVTHYRVTYALIGIAIASSVLGAVWILRRRAFAPLLLLVGNAIAAAYLLSRASPYASAKVMAIFSLTVVLTAMLGAAALHDSGRRFEGWALAAVLAGGVLWTNALAYHDASIAPRARFEELGAIGHRFAGQGPAFYNLSDELAIHFLRSEAPSDPAVGPPVPRAGLAPRTPAQARLPWDPGELAPSYLQAFRLLVLGRSPRVSRPPADYALAYRGRYYEVWRRTSAPTVLEHVPLAGPLEPVSVPSCQLVREIATRAAREHARLAYVASPPAPALVPTDATRPPNWGLVEGQPFTLIPREQSGSVTGTIDVSHPGRYQVWLEGSFSQRLHVWLGGHQVGSAAYELGPPGQFVQVGEVTLGAGPVPAVVVRPAASLGPGQESSDQLLGPLMLVPSAGPPAVAEVEPAHAASLCGRSLEWIEIVR